MRDGCNEIRDLAIIDLLASTGMRVGELVNLKIEKELGIEVLGNATVKIQVEDDYDDYEEVYDEENNDELNINVDDLNDDYLENK